MFTNTQQFTTMTFKQVFKAIADCPTITSIDEKLIAYLADNLKLPSIQVVCGMVYMKGSGPVSLQSYCSSVVRAMIESQA